MMGLRGTGMAGPRSAGQASRGDVEEGEFGQVFDSGLLSRLWRDYLLPRRGQLALALLLSLVATSATVAEPYIVAVTINGPIEHHSSGGIAVMVVVYVVAMAIGWLTQYGQGYVMAVAGQSALYEMGHDLFSHLQRLPVEFFDRTSSGRVMSRLQNDVTVLQQALSGGALSMIASSLSLVFTVSVLLWMSWSLALAMLAVLPLLSAGSIVWQRHTRRWFIETRRSIAGVNAHLQETISGIRTIQSLNQQDRNALVFRQHNLDNFETNLAA